MDYLELSVSVRPEAVEAAAELLRRVAPAGVSIEPPYEATDEDGGVALAPDAPVRLRAWLPVGDAARNTARALRRDLRAFDGVVRPLRARTVRDRAWADAWKRHFPVLRIGLIVIRPSWRAYRPRIGEVVIDLDPGMAFGTGQHETTRMCMLALEERLRHGMRVLDVGCGSGILAIAAARLGAERVDALDIDPVAVRAAKENAARNGVDDVVQAAEGSLGDAWPFAAPAAGRYDLVLANLSSRLVQELAAPLIEALRPGGVALVSGLIAGHEPACRAALESAAARVTETRSDGEWRLLVAERGWEGVAEAFRPRRTPLPGSVPSLTRSLPPPPSRSRSAGLSYPRYDRQHLDGTGSGPTAVARFNQPITRRTPCRRIEFPPESFFTSISIKQSKRPREPTGRRWCRSRGRGRPRRR